jgi:hypothetical protein
MNKQFEMWLCKVNTIHNPALRLDAPYGVGVGLEEILLTATPDTSIRELLAH